jgi:hypothetical protein
VIQSKIHFYLWWIASESVETQRKGLVFVTIHNPAISDATSPTPAMSSYDNDNDQTADHGQTTSDQNDDEPHKHDISGLPSMEFAKFYVTRRNSKPVRMVACHVCTPDTPFYNIVRSFNAAMLGTDERCRMKIHVGTFCTLCFVKFCQVASSTRITDMLCCERHCHHACART